MMKGLSGSQPENVGTDNLGETPLPDSPSPTVSHSRIPSINKRYRAVLIAVLLGLVTIAIFRPSGQFDFVSLDDNVYVTANPRVQKGVTADGLRWSFTNFDSGTWHPLTWISHMLDCELYGLKAGGHHWTNILIHAAASVLLFLVLNAMTGFLWGSGLVAAFFALHPLHVESVAWVAERKDVLSGFFWVATMGAYYLYVKKPGAPRYLLVLASLALGLLSKPMLVTLPIVLLSLDYWPLRRHEQPTTLFDNSLRTYPFFRHAFSRLIAEKIPLFFLSLAAGILALIGQRSIGAIQTIEVFPFWERFTNAIVSYVWYIWKMILPLDLAVYYPHAGMPPFWKWMGAFVILVVITALVLRWARTHPYLLVGWLWYVVTLLPVIGFVQIGAQAMADRYTYISLIGLFIMMVWGAYDAAGARKYPRVALDVFFPAVIIALMVLTAIQLSYWRDSRTLYGHALTVTEGNHLIHNNLGNELAGAGEMDKALVHYLEAVRIYPDYADGHYNLANAFARIGEDDQAIRYYLEAIRIMPDHEKAHYNLGITFARYGNLDKAMEYFSGTLKINPNSIDARYNLGSALAAKGEYSKAITHFTEILRLNPGATQARVRLGKAYWLSGDREAALKEYEGIRASDEKMARDFMTWIERSGGGKK
ncbi:MAG: tetratricopeptide repeat protein [Deltaproteobacteria bacterium]|nr:tetratricopeptide repeat protein [Deltaproteobacteria bacterium]